MLKVLYYGIYNIIKHQNYNDENRLWSFCVTLLGASDPRETAVAVELKISRTGAGPTDRLPCPAEDPARAGCSAQL